MTELFLFPIPVFNASRYKHDSIYALLTEDGSVANYVDSDDGEYVAGIARRQFPSYEVRLYPSRDATAPDLPQWAKHSRVIGALEEGRYRGLSSVFRGLSGFHLFMQSLGAVVHFPHDLPLGCDINVRVTGHVQDTPLDTRARLHFESTTRLTGAIETPGALLMLGGERSQVFRSFEIALSSEPAYLARLFGETYDLESVPSFRFVDEALDERVRKETLAALAQAIGWSILWKTSGDPAAAITLENENMKLDARAL